jgi:hypothetical protein
MMNLPPLAPLATAGAPVSSTIVVVGAPLVFAGALLVGVLALVLCVDVLRTRRRAGTRIAPAMPYAAAHQR